MTTCVSIQDVGSLRIINLNRPDALNAFNRQLRKELREAFELTNATIAESPTRLRAVLIQAQGPAFCVGQDLKEHLEELQAGTGLNKVVDEYNPMIAELIKIPVPVVAAISGPAAGAGWSLALACDFRIASQQASFKPAFADVGLATDCGLSATLTALVGPARALEITLKDKKITAEQALTLGLVTEVVEDARAEDAALEFAQTLAKGPTQSYKEIKALIRDASRINEAANAEAAAQARLSQTSDHREALSAFLGKRKPRFTGE